MVCVEDDGVSRQEGEDGDGEHRKEMVGKKVGERALYRLSTRSWWVFLNCGFC